MCGIAGILHFDDQAPSPVVLRRMTDAIAHRGPDGEGHWIRGPVGLGHRRLAIIDLSPAGHQPMQTPDGRFTVTYNGEVYNFRELRTELESAGWQFHSQSDTEVVLYALAAWGEAALTRFNGMFALAMWDSREQRLLLARDRYGIKPLYYQLADKALLFGSECKAILAHPLSRRRMDREALLEYFTFQNFFTDRTLLEGVRTLPPGSYAYVSQRGMSEPVRYWDFDFHDTDTAVREEEATEELVRLLRQAVVRQLVSDVELAAYLSGGMDSGTIAAIAAPNFPNFRTFTCGFDLHSASGMEMAFDERQSAEHMSYLFQTEHYEMVLKAGDMQRVIPRLTHHLEEPRVGQSYPNFYIAQLASKFVKVVLAGTGGDELFAGYPWRYYRAMHSESFEQYIDDYYLYWQRLIPNKTIRRAFDPIWPDVQHVWTRDIFRDVFRTHAAELTRPEDYINHCLYLEARTFLHGLLTVEDKLSMAHGLEVRVPFLDNDLVDFAMRVPVKYKLARIGEARRIDLNEPGAIRAKQLEAYNDGKMILRKAMARYIPADITRARKQGFSAPDASWFRGQSMQYVQHVLFDRRARIYDYLDASTVRELVTDHLDGRVNRRLLIWSLLNVEQFCREFLD